MEPLTNRRPKPMVPVANRPLLEHVVETIAAAGIDRLVIVVGYQQERIRNHFGDGASWDVTIEYVEQATQLGTGHAILQAEPAVDGPFVVLNGDRIVDPEIVRTICDRVHTGESPVMAVTAAAQPRDYGVVSLDGDSVTAIAEKPEGPIETNRINAGVYGFTPAVFDAIRDTHTTGEVTITATLNKLAATGEVTAVSYDGRWLDVSNLWDMLAVNGALIGTQSTKADSNGREGGQSTNTDRRQDADSVAVADDVALADDVYIGPNATVGGASAIGRNTTIEANAVIENAVIFPDVVIGAGAVVRDAVVASNVAIGPNTTVAGDPATVVVGDRVHHDVDLGGVIGDNTTVGAGATVTDGAIVGDDVSASAGVVIDDRVETDSVVRRG